MERYGTLRNLCVYPGCENTRRTRGLCHGHYQTMRTHARKVRDRDGQAAVEKYEASLEGRRLLMPKGTGGTSAPDTLDAFKAESTVIGEA